MDTYTNNVDCANCGTTNTLTIAKGTTVAVAKATAICVNCGCNVE